MIDACRDGDADHRRLVVSGELDAETACRLQKVVIDVLRHGRPRSVDLDFHEANFVDSAGIRPLVMCHTDAQQVDCHIRLTGLQPPVLRVLEIPDFWNPSEWRRRNGPGEPLDPAEALPSWAACSSAKCTSTPWTAGCPRSSSRCTPKRARRPSDEPADM